MAKNDQKWSKNGHLWVINFWDFFFQNLKKWKRKEWKVLWQNLPQLVLISYFVGWVEEDTWFHGFSIQETAVLMLRILWWVQNLQSFGAKIACWSYNHYYVAIYVKEPVAKVLFKDILISNQVLLWKYYYLYGRSLDQFTNHFRNMKNLDNWQT